MTKGVREKKYNLCFFTLQSPPLFSLAVKSLSSSKEWNMECGVDNDSDLFSQQPYFTYLAGDTK